MQFFRRVNPSNEGSVFASDFRIERIVHSTMNTVQINTLQGIVADNIVKNMVLVTFLDNRKTHPIGVIVDLCTNSAILRHLANLSHVLLSLSLSSLLLISTLYRVYLEFSREILKFFCQEILTKLFGFFICFGIPYARAKSVPY